jgi:tetratricopeptide (TPR) repeat protein
VPIELEGFLEGSTETQIVLDERTAGIPWELLDDGTGNGDGGRPWAIRSKLLRKFKTETFRGRVTDAPGQSAMLVVGEPLCPPDYPPLPGAYQEAKAVYDCLKTFGEQHKIDVTGLMAASPDGPRPAAREVVNTLLEKPWRVIHVAGHGALPDSDGGTGGVVLTDNTFLGPREMAAMRVVPSLVFLNCCHLGAFPSDSVLSERVRFAAGVARSLIELGVKCVVVAGWAVSDDVAQLFAETFYRSLLNGARFIDAVGDARAAAYERDDNTWAAYQCYGDPEWRLVSDSDGTTPSAAPDEFNQIGTVAGLQIALQTLIVQSTYQSQLNPPRLQLERLTNLQQRWRAMKSPLGDGIGELFGDAYQAVGDLPEAIRWYDAVIAAPDVPTSVRAVEQRCNLHVRQAWEQVSSADTARKAAAESGATARALRVRGAALRKATIAARRVITLETQKLSGLEPFGSTTERYDLLGSAMKRLAMIERIARRPAAERAALERMRRYYEKALECDRKVPGGPVFYSAINLMLANLALGKHVSDALFEEARASQKSAADRDPDFWSVVAETELKLLEAVDNGAVARRQSLIIRGYTDLSKRMHNSTYWRSVYDTVAFVLAPAGRGRPRGKSRGATPRRTRDETAKAAILAKLEQISRRPSIDEPTTP